VTLRVRAEIIEITTKEASLLDMILSKTFPVAIAHVERVGAREKTYFFVLSVTKETGKYYLNFMVKREDELT